MYTLISLCLLGTFKIASSTPIVAQTEYGPIEGKIVEMGGIAAEFYNSVPYAAEPTGNLRFESPQPPKSWDFPIVTDYEVICPQYHVVPPITRLMLNETENCLLLKIVIPLNDNKTRYAEKLPIVYWVHGMSYTKGGKFAYGAAGILPHFSAKKTIFVAVDYRLGFDGFLSSHDPEIAGNYGLEDVIFGLEFVKRNAKHFGGDPERITIGGESVGGSLAGLAAASPRSKGLISGVMMFSGTSLTNWAVRSNFTKGNSEKIIAHCNCTHSDPKIVKGCMKMKSPTCYRSNLWLVKWDFLWDSPERLMFEILRMGFTLATPVRDDFRENGLLPGDIMELIRRNHRNISILISHVAHERATALKHTVWPSGFPASYYVNALVYSHGPSVGAVRKVMRDRYTPLGDVYGPSETTNLLTQLMQDDFTADGEAEAKIYAENGADVHVILNDVFDEPTGGPNMSLVSEHCMDMVFLFNEPHVCNPLLVVSDMMLQRGIAFGNKLADIVANFTHRGVIPTVQRYSESNMAVKRFSYQNEEVSMSSAENFYFWRQLIPTLERMNVTLPEAIPTCPPPVHGWPIHSFAFLASLLMLNIIIFGAFCISRLRVRSQEPLKK